MRAESRAHYCPGGHRARARADRCPERGIRIPESGVGARNPESGVALESGVRSGARIRNSGVALGIRSSESRAESGVRSPALSLCASPGLMPHDAGSRSVSPARGSAGQLEPGQVRVFVFAAADSRARRRRISDSGFAPGTQFRIPNSRPNSGFRIRARVRIPNSRPARSSPPFPFFRLSAAAWARGAEEPTVLSAASVRACSRARFV